MRLPLRHSSAAGADVILHYSHSRDAAQAIADQIGSSRCYLLQADLGSSNATSSLWQEAIAKKGRIDILVNNAGMIQSAGIDDDFEQSANAWQQTLQVNLIAVADLCRAAIRHFQTRSGGIIINVASRAAFRGDTPDYMHYAASKAGVVVLTRSIARGFAGDHILAYAVAPGFVSTEMIDGFIQEYGAAALTRDLPLVSHHHKMLLM